MDLKNLAALVKLDETIYITEAQRVFNALEHKSEIYLTMDLIEPGKCKHSSFDLPEDFSETALITDFFYGKIYNIISTLGGRCLTIYYDTGNAKIAKLVERLNMVFGIHLSKRARSGYARGINVADRMNEALYGGRFCIKTDDIANKPEKPVKTAQNKKPLDYVGIVDNLQGLMCGIDIGGTDIKIAVSLDNEIVCFKEYDWYPASYKTINEIIHPIERLIKLLRIKATFEILGGTEVLHKLLDIALDKHAEIADISRCVSFGESLYKDKIVLFDSIGMSFPDVVARNKIVGGEVSKVKSVRENDDIDFETEFKKLSDLDVILQNHCKKDGVVNITNDGPMAAFTAAVELAYGEGEPARQKRRVCAYPWYRTRYWMGG